jgi:uncharacterized protein (TIGR02996 family)
VDTEERLLQALVDAPHDDATRSVYADWLEENGDIRAEFLRLQVTLKSLPLGTPGNTLGQKRLRQLRWLCPQDWVRLVEPLALLGDLSQRARWCLRRMKVTTLGGLHERTGNDILTAILSETVLNEFAGKLAVLGLSMEDGPPPRA